MKYSILFIFLLLIKFSAAEPLQKIKQLIKERDFAHFESYIDNLPSSNVSAGWETLRDIVGEYQEGVVKIEQSFPVNDGTGASTINMYMIYLLTTKEKIFYYKFAEIKYKKIGDDQWQPYENLIDSFNDNHEYNNLKTSFIQSYHETLNQADLFITTIAYGHHCGFAGVNPEYLQQLDFFLLNNNVAAIRHWLKSANAEKQLYAVRGYRFLISKGYVLTQEEQQILAIVKRKTGMVSTCGGCTYMMETFQQVISEINSSPIEYLKPEKLTASNQQPPKKQAGKISSSPARWLYITSFIILFIILYIERKRKLDALKQSNKI